MDNKWTVRAVSEDARAMIEEVNEVIHPEQEPESKAHSSGDSYYS